MWWLTKSSPYPGVSKKMFIIFLHKWHMKNDLVIAMNAWYFWINMQCIATSHNDTHKPCWFGFDRICLTTSQILQDIIPPTQQWQCANTTWWRHQTETFSALLARCERNRPVIGVFPSQRPVTWSFDFYSLICAWNGWTNGRVAGKLRRQSAYYDITVMWPIFMTPL